MQTFDASLDPNGLGGISEILCEHKNFGAVHYAHGLCRGCYDEVSSISPCSLISPVQMGCDSYLRSPVTIVQDSLLNFIFAQLPLIVLSQYTVCEGVWWHPRRVCSTRFPTCRAKAAEGSQGSRATCYGSWEFITRWSSFFLARRGSCKWWRKRNEWRLYTREGYNS